MSLTCALTAAWGLVPAHLSDEQGKPKELDCTEMLSKYSIYVQVFDLSATTVENAIKQVFAKLEELDNKGYSQARYIASKVSFVLVGDHKRAYTTLQVLHVLFPPLSHQSDSLLSYSTPHCTFFLLCHPSEHFSGSSVSPCMRKRIYAALLSGSSGRPEYLVHVDSVGCCDPRIPHGYPLLPWKQWVSVGRGAPCLASLLDELWYQLVLQVLKCGLVAQVMSM